MSYQFRSASQNRMPPAILNLIVLNVIMFVAKFIAANRFIDLDALLALHHPFSPDFHFFQYITSMFMHANFQHILFNMFGLWIFGVMLENVWGTKRFLIFYLICGVGAALIYQAWQSFDWVHLINVQIGDQLPAGTGFFEKLRMYPPQGEMLGASGAIYGVIAGAAMLFPNTQMYLMFLPVPIKLKWVAIGYGFIELYSSWQQAPGDNVAHFAHLGGMIFGFILVKIYNRNKKHFY